MKKIGFPKGEEKQRRSREATFDLSPRGSLFQWTGTQNGMDGLRILVITSDLLLRLSQRQGQALRLSLIGCRRLTLPTKSGPGLWRYSSG